MARRAKPTEADEAEGANPTWKGSLKLSLISIPIRVFAATNPGSDVRFRQVHRKCHTPIQLKKWCPHCDVELTADDIVRGHEVSKGKYALVDDAELAELRPETTHVIELSHLVAASAVDPVYIERAYVLAPDSKIAGAAFAVFREALGDDAAIGRMSLHRREYLAAVLPRDPALMLYTLRTKGEVRDLTAATGLSFAEAKTKPEEVRLARQVLQSLETASDLSSFTDHYQESLRAMLARKVEGEVVSVDGGDETGKVVNLMEALRQSLARAGSRGAKAAKAESEPARKPARVLAHPSTSARKRRKAS